MLKVALLKAKVEKKERVCQGKTLKNIPQVQIFRWFCVLFHYDLFEVLYYYSASTDVRLWQL